MQLQEQKIIEEIKRIHKELITECEKLYLEDIKALIDIESKLLGKNGKLELLEIQLEKMYLTSYLPKPDCEFIKEK